MSATASPVGLPMPPEGRVAAVTGASGFIGRNLVARLAEAGWAVRPIGRDTPIEESRAALAEAGVVFHLAGVNRPSDPADHRRSNHDYAAWVADAIALGGRRPLVIVSSSTKASEDSDYGRSKRGGEAAMFGLAVSGGATVAIYRLPNVFGRWARPNYNSAVATFCHNLARGLPIRIDDPDAPLSLLHVDDLIDQWLGLVEAGDPVSGYVEPACVHHMRVGVVARMIRGFAAASPGSSGAELGEGLPAALHATFAAALADDPGGQGTSARPPVPEAAS